MTKNYLSNFPLLINEWDFENNKRNPSELTYGSEYNAAWICSVNPNHKWRASINNRTSGKGTGCPYCAGRLVCVDNCLATTHPHLVKEWDFENNKLTPYDITAGSSCNIFWICSINSNHKWSTSIRYRTNGKGTGCPYCTGRLVCIDNCLATTHPYLAKEWDADNNDLTPYDITAGSGRIVNWKCQANHKWSATINNRKQGYGCPYCSGQAACIDNCLATTHPHLVKEWDDSNNFTPYDITAGSNKKANWICGINSNHKWSASIGSRVRGTGCPYCSGQAVCIDNCLATTHPDLIKEWDFENNKLTPYDVVFGTRLKVNWICSTNPNHKWSAAINKRASRHTGCPHCRICYHEIMCQKIVGKMLGKEFGRYSCSSLKNRYGKRLYLDCYNEELRINIEYDGEQHYIFPNCFHRTKDAFIRQQSNDHDKDMWCKNNGVLQIRVMYTYDTNEEISNFIKQKLISNGILVEIAAA